MYTKTEWLDNIIDTDLGQVIQEGTRFTASRMNNIENGISNAYKDLKSKGIDITKLRIQLEMIDRVPDNNGVFYDPIEEGGQTKALGVKGGLGISQQLLEIGATSITIDKEALFNIGEQVTIYDNVSYEEVKIINVVGSLITVSPLTNSFVKGAYLTRSNTTVLNNKLNYPIWGNYTVTMKEVI